jgi:TolB-like protein
MLVCGGLSLLAFGGCGGLTAATPAEDRQASMPAAGQPAPGWVRSHRDARYPDQLYLTGVGEAASGFAEAEAQARTDLAKRIEVQIEGEDRFLAVEATEGGYRYAVRSDVSEAVAVKLTGLTIEDRWQDSRSRRFFALAVLQREKAASAVRRDLDALLDDAGTVQAKVKALEAQEEPLRALWAYAQLQNLASEIQSLRRRYLVVRGDTPDPRPLQPAPSAVETEQRMQDLLASLRLLPVAGDGQRAMAGRPLERPLTVRFLSRLGGKEVPIRDLPILYAFDRGQGQVNAMVRTDPAGQAAATVREVKPSEESTTVSARPDLDAATAGMPASLRQRVGDMLKQQVVTFTIVPPRSLQAGADPVMRAVGRLGETLLSRFDFEEKGKPSLAVLDFLETYGNQRLPLSQRLETGLRTALAQWEFVSVVQRDVPPTASKPEEKARALGVEHYVDGLYVLSKDTVTVNASLHKVTDGTTRAAGAITIPREELTPQDLQGFLDRSNITPSGITIMPDEPPPSYDEFLSRLVMLHQSAPPFGLRLWTNKASYAIGEKVVFNVEAEQDCYLTLVDIGTSGNLTVLFPNAYDRNNRIQAGRRYEIPGASYGFDIHVGGPTGIERVKAIATTQPFTLFENMDLSQGFFGLTRGGTRGWEATLRDFKVSPKQVAPSQWTDAAIEILVLDQGKAEPRGRGLVEKEKGRRQEVGGPGKGTR